jgi:L-alanine-DL-glutamate epimerase-like enolase superfamily enzyme
MKLTTSPFSLIFSHTFKISKATRNTTDTVYAKVEHEDHVGYGEASLPPYVENNQEEVIQKLNDFKLPENLTLDHIHEYLHSLDDTFKDIMPAKAALDIAFHDLIGKINKISVREMYSLPEEQNGLCSFTLSMTSKETYKSDIIKHPQFHFYKIKLDGKNDLDRINDYLSICKEPFAVDVNQAWSDKNYALEMAEWLKSKGALFIEEPMKSIQDTAWLSHHTKIPVIADENFQRIYDLKEISEAYSGINVKLSKCGGIDEAYRILKHAKEMNLKTMLGCMSESSCGVAAAGQLAPMCDWLDLDGPYLIKNDPFKGYHIIDGDIEFDYPTGIGVIPKNGLLS